MKIESSTELKGKSHQYVVSSASADKVKQSADNIMAELGYKLAKEDWTGNVYTKGNRVLRILFGAFVKYNKVIVQASEKDGAVTLNIINDSSGFSGGLIGMSQVNKEYKRIIAAFEEKLGSVLY